MTPRNIVQKAKENHLDIIGITDHNSTRNAILVKKLAEKEGILFLPELKLPPRKKSTVWSFLKSSHNWLNFSNS